MAITPMPEVNRAPEPAHKAGITPVATVEAKRKSKAPIAISSIFQVNDLKQVEDYIVNGVMIPNIRSAIYNVITGAINMVFWGNGNVNGNVAQGLPKVSYNQTQYNNYSKPNYQPKMQVNSQPKPNQLIEVPKLHGLSRYDDIVAPTRGAAEEIINQMFDIMGQYDSVSILDLYDICGRHSTPTDATYGWIRGTCNATDFKVTPTMEGFLLVFPPAVPLN